MANTLSHTSAAERVTIHWCRVSLLTVYSWQIRGRVETTLLWLKGSLDGMLCSIIILHAEIHIHRNGCCQDVDPSCIIVSWGGSFMRVLVGRGVREMIPYQNVNIQESIATLNFSNIMTKNSSMHFWISDLWPQRLFESLLFKVLSLWYLLLSSPGTVFT